MHKMKCGTSAKLIQCNASERIQKINILLLSEMYGTMINVAAEQFATLLRAKTKIITKHTLLCVAQLAHPACLLPRKIQRITRTHSQHIPKHLKCPWHALSIAHIGSASGTLRHFWQRIESNPPILCHSKQNKLNKYERNEMMKNEKAPNLRNYEKVARTATNVIGMQFREARKKESDREREGKSRGYSFVFELFMGVCMCSSRLNVLCDENRCRTFFFEFVRYSVVVDSRQKCLCCRLQFRQKVIDHIFNNFLSLSSSLSLPRV